MTERQLQHKNELDIQVYSLESQRHLLGSLMQEMRKAVASKMPSADKSVGCASLLKQDAEDCLETRTYMRCASLVYSSLVQDFYLAREDSKRIADMPNIEVMRLVKSYRESAEQSYKFMHMHN